jgi:nucleotide-binding universal stress UspA family protein
MFEKVLTATDMLEACDAAVVAALAIAKQNRGKLFVIHVLEPSYFHECGPLESVKNFKTGEDTAASQEYREAVKQELDKKCEGALKPYGNYQIDIAYGKPSIEIRRWARKMGADLIVLGPHAGKPEREDELIGIPIGNTVEDVILHTTTPVMIISRFIPQEKLNFKKVMVCVDFSKSCKHACEFAAKLAHKYGAKLFPFHMATATESGERIEATRKKVEEFCKMFEGLNCEYVVWEGSEPYSEILKYAGDRDIDVVLMGSHTKEEGEKAYVGSAVEMVSAGSRCPVLVVTHPDAVSRVK